MAIIPFSTKKKQQVKVVQAQPTQTITGVVTAQPKAKIIPFRQEVKPEAKKPSSFANFDFPINELTANSTPMQVEKSDALTRSLQFGVSKYKEFQASNMEASRQQFIKAGATPEEATLANEKFNELLGAIDIAGTSKYKNLYQRIAKTKKAEAIAPVLTKLGVEENKISILSKQLEKVKDEKRVETILKNFIPQSPSVNTYKSEANAFPKSLRQAEDPLLTEARKTATPKTVKVWIKSKFSDGGSYAEVPVIRKEENITLYQGGSGEGRQFWTPDKKYAEQFGDVTEKTGTFYKIDNGNRVTDVYVEAPSKSTVDPLIAEARKYKSAEEFVKSYGEGKAKLPSRSVSSDANDVGANPTFTPSGSSKPKPIVYHGTNATFDNFTRDFAGKSSMNQRGDIGIFFTTEPESAKFFGNNVKEAFINLENPKLMTREQYRLLTEKQNGKTIREQLQKQGYDGIIAKGKSEKFAGQTMPAEDWYVAFEPNQIVTKSQLTDIWKKANSEFPVSQAGFIDPGQIATDIKTGTKIAMEKGADLKLEAKTQLYDRYAPIQDLIKDTKLTAKADPYIAARNYAGHMGKVENRLDDLSNILRPNKDILPDVKEFALLERYQELAGRGITKFPGGITIDQINAQKAALEGKLGQQGMSQVNEAIGGIRKYNDRLLTEAKDAGIISQESFDAIKKNNQKYIPLQRLEYLAEQADNLPVGSNSFSVATQKIIKPIKGSDKAIVDPIESMVRNTYSTINLIERNKVAQKVADLASLSEFKGIVQKIEGATPAGFEKISVFRNGIKEEYAVPKGVGEALKGMNKEQSDFITKWASLSSSALRTGATTLNLAFIPSNIIRDFQTATVVSKVGFTPFDWARGFAEAIKKGDDYKAFLENGGGFSGYFERGGKTAKTVKKLTESNLSKTVKTIINPVELIRKGAEITELAPRLGVFKRSLRKGLSGTEAAFNARNATVDFAKSGDKMKVINQWVPFLNARLQGTANVLGAIKNRPVSSALKLSVLVGAPVLATYLNNTRNHEEVWNDIPQYEKDSNYLIIYGDEKDAEGKYTQVIKIPKGDVGSLFGNVQENFMAYLDGKDRKPLDELALQTFSNLSPVSFEKEGKPSGGTALSSILPPAIKGGVETVTNKNLYTGFDIVPQSMVKASPEQQYDDKTSTIAKELGKFLGWSPKKIDNFISTQFAGVGRQVTNPGTAGEQITGRFIGSRGGKESQDIAKEAEEAVRIQADKKLEVKRRAQELLERLSSESPEQAAQDFDAIARSDSALAKTIVDLKEKQDLGFTNKDYVIQELGVENGERAKFLVGQFGKLKNDEEKAALWDDLVKKKLITKNVADQMSDLLQ